jgi:hypothetical protein
MYTLIGNNKDLALMRDGKADHSLANRWDSLPMPVTHRQLPKLLRIRAKENPDDFFTPQVLASDHCNSPVGTDISTV